MPWAPVPWLDINPLLSYRWTYYTQHQETVDTTRMIVDQALSRELLAGGLEIIGPKLYRIFERPNSPFSTRYKHSIETRFVWGYADSFDRKDEIIPFDEVDKVSGSGNQVNYALVQRLFAQRPRAEPPTVTSGTDLILLPDGTTSSPGEPLSGADVPPDPDAEPDPDVPREPVEIASLELRQRRSFDESLSQADLDGDGEYDAFSAYSDIAIVGRYNPSTNTSLDLRGNYHILYNELSNVTLSGGIRRRLAQLRFSVVHRNGLAAGARDDTQLRLTTGFNLLQSRLRLDLDGSFVLDPPEGQTPVPDWRWRVQYATQCYTFILEQLHRDFTAAGTDRDDFYFRVDFKGVGKILDFNY
jgi:hypothetical protein